MHQLSLTHLWHKLEDWRLRQHFKRVEAILRKRDVSHLSPTLQQARQYYLDQLHNYAVQGIFPRNHEKFAYSPCFIDRDGRDCAVAHLVKVSGHNELAQEIALAENYAYILEMDFPELDKWAAQTGLSKEELTLIQPGYWYAFWGSLQTVALAAWTAGILLSAVNIVQVIRRRNEIVIPIAALIVAIILLLISIVCFLGARGAYYLGTHSDGFPYEIPLRDVQPLLLGGQISLIFTLLTGGIAIYRIWRFYHSWRKSHSSKAKV